MSVSSRSHDFEFDQESPEYLALHMEAATGTGVQTAQMVRTMQLIQALHPQSDPEEMRRTQYAAVCAMSAIGPMNELEGMLAAQMVAVHHAAMVCMTRFVNSFNFPELRAHEFSGVTKLLQLYTRQLDAFAKLRESDKFANYANLPSPKAPRKRPASPPGSPDAAKDPNPPPDRACDDPA